MEFVHFEATVKLAFDGVGATLPHHLRATSRLVDGMGAVATAAKYARDGFLKNLGQRIAGGNPDFLMVRREPADSCRLSPGWALRGGGQPGVPLVRRDATDPRVGFWTADGGSQRGSVSW